MKRLLILLLFVCWVGCGSSNSPLDGKRNKADLEEARGEKASLERKLSILESKETSTVKVGSEGITTSASAHKEVTDCKENLERVNRHIKSIEDQIK